MRRADRQGFVFKTTAGKTVDWIYKVEIDPARPDTVILTTQDVEFDCGREPVLCVPLSIASSTLVQNAFQSRRSVSESASRPVWSRTPASWVATSQRPSRDGPEDRSRGDPFSIESVMAARSASSHSRAFRRNRSRVARSGGGFSLLSPDAARAAAQAAAYRCPALNSPASLGSAVKSSSQSCAEVAKSCLIWQSRASRIRSDAVAGCSSLRSNAGRRAFERDHPLGFADQLGRGTAVGRCRASLAGSIGRMTELPRIHPWP